MDKPEPTPGRPCERTFLLEDIAIRSDGEGRTVVAYAAVFNIPAEINDQDGHYLETLAAGAFDKTLERGIAAVQVFYNHGRTLYGTPSERASLPLGAPEEIKADARGLYTVTRYNRTPFADEVLESIRNGDIRGQSFSGKFMPGRSKRTRGKDGELDIIVRNEVALREYGPTPMPSYKEAAIVGVRAEDLAAVIDGLDDEQRTELIRILGTSRIVGTPPPVDDAAQEGTSPANATPASRHLSPTPTERRQRVLAFLREVA
jgi:HK97 family phage prohead protease